MGPKKSKKGIVQIMQDKDQMRMQIRCNYWIIKFKRCKNS